MGWNKLNFKSIHAHDTWFYWSSENTLHERERWCWVWTETPQLTALDWKNAYGSEYKSSLRLIQVTPVPELFSGFSYCESFAFIVFACLFQLLHVANWELLLYSNYVVFLKGKTEWREKENEEEKKKKKR